MIEFRPGEQNGTLSYTAFDGQAKLGHALFTRQGEAGRLLAVEAEDFMIADGLVRCVLNFLLEHGAKTAVCACPVEERILTRLHFVKEDGVFTVRLAPEIFSCNCHAE